MQKNDEKKKVVTDIFDVTIEGSDACMHQSSSVDMQVVDVYLTNERPMLVMCWAGPQALSPLSPARSSPSQAQPRQGLGVGLGLA